MSQQPLSSDPGRTKASTVLSDIAQSLGYSQADLVHVQKRLEQGEPLFHILNMDPHLLEERYAIALNFYQSGKLADALVLFRWLCLFNGTSPANWMGLGACLQGQGTWEEACTAYGLAVAWSGEKDPKALYAYGVANYQLGRREAAKQALEEVVVQIGFTNEEERELLRRACVLLQSIEQGA